MTFKKIAIIIFLIMVIIFILQNTQPVTLRFLFWQLTMSRILLYPILLMIGFITGWVFKRQKRFEDS